MGGSRAPEPIGTNPGAPSPSGSRAFRPGPVGTELRFPTLEVFAALHGDLGSREGLPLTPDQIDLARPIFGASIAYGLVRLVVAAVANAPTTLGNFIRISSEDRRNGVPSSTLIHELTHVWQFQTRGMRYMSNSLCQQMTAIIKKGDRNFAYDLTGKEIMEAGSIDRLPAEKQAMLVELWFLDQTMVFPDNALPQRLRDNAVCQSMIGEIQAARPLALGQIIDEAAFGPGNHRAFLPPAHEPEDQPVPLLRFEF
jgi:hypothetical protein